MQEELNNFKRNQVWSLVERSKQNIVRIKWVFHNKQDEFRVVTRNKARLMSKGYSQKFLEQVPNLKIHISSDKYGPYRTSPVRCSTRQVNSIHRISPRPDYKTPWPAIDCSFGLLSSKNFSYRRLGQFLGDLEFPHHPLVDF
jgi:hypothetical protein